MGWQQCYPDPRWGWKQGWDRNWRCCDRGCLRQPLPHTTRFRTAREPHALLSVSPGRPPWVRTHLQRILPRSCGDRRCCGILLHWQHCVRVRHGDPAWSRKIDQEPVCGPPGCLVRAGPTPQENHSQQKRHPMEHQLERPGAKHVGHSDVIRGTGGSLPAGHRGLLQP